MNLRKQVESLGKAALTELFEEARNEQTPILVERVVGVIDEIVPEPIDDEPDLLSELIAIHDRFDASALAVQEVPHEDVRDLLSCRQAAAYGLPYEAPPVPEREIADGDALEVAGLRFDVLHAPVSGEPSPSEVMRTWAIAHGLAAEQRMVIAGPAFLALALPRWLLGAACGMKGSPTALSTSAGDIVMAMPTIGTVLDSATRTWRCCPQCTTAS